jgi:hypothetical protein
MYRYKKGYKCIQVYHLGLVWSMVHGLGTMSYGRWLMVDDSNVLEGGCPRPPVYQYTGEEYRRNGVSGYRRYSVLLKWRDAVLSVRCTDTATRGHGDAETRRVLVC